MYKDFCGSPLWTSHKHKLPSCLLECSPTRRLCFFARVTEPMPWGQTARGSGSATIVPPEFHSVWNLKALQMGLELWGTLECFISPESGTITWQAFELWPLLEAWMVSDCLEQTELRCFDFASRIQPCYRAAKESMTACSSAKRLKKNTKTTDLEVRTARNLLRWWISHCKVCFSNASGNKSF